MYIMYIIFGYWIKRQVWDRQNTEHQLVTCLLDLLVVVAVERLVACSQNTWVKHGMFSHGNQTRMPHTVYQKRSYVKTPLGMSKNLGRHTCFWLRLERPLRPFDEASTEHGSSGSFHAVFSYPSSGRNYWDSCYIFIVFNEFSENSLKIWFWWVSANEHSSPYGFHMVFSHGDGHKVHIFK